MITRAILTLPLLLMAALLPTPVTGNEGGPMPSQDSRTELKITIVYDNSLHTPGLTAGWGFSAIVEYEGRTLLFDTGAEGQALLNNMAALHIDPQDIEGVVLSHNHWDHTGGLNVLLATGVQPDVYLLPSFPPASKQPISRMTTVIETTTDQAIVEGILTTGEMGGDIPEQAIAIETELGLVMLTGCAHPGIVAMIEHVKASTGQPVYLVLGGFHLKDTAPADVAAIVQSFRRLGVKRVGPCHCTGEQAIAAFAEEYGDDFVRIGTGYIIEIEFPSG
jgi:7,8-dihydropterin-6-yl-methyl-4-(beta-D-ribofuranosyl)aminobenzene 5'-phosphate synthase